MRGKVLVWAALCVAAVGCVSQWRVETYAAPEGDVASRRTFFWKGGDVATAQYVEPEVLKAADVHVHAAVTTELQRRGFTEVASQGEADLLVSYRVTGMRRFISDETPRVGAPSPNQVLRPGTPQPPPASTVPREIALREGTVALYLDDTKLGRMVWRGEVQAEIRSGSPDHTGRTIAGMAREIAREVPQSKAPAP